MPIMSNWLLATIPWSEWGQFLAAQYLMWKIPLQFLLVFVLVSWFYFKIHGTYVAQLLKGVAVVLAFYLLAGIFNLTIISGILQAILQISIIGFIILFQPELRRLLVYLGQPDLFNRSSLLPGGKEKDAAYLVHELVESVRLLSKTKTGALIVLESTSGLGGNYLEAGTRLDARLSTELLLTIFHPNTPLHDGAIIINPSDNRIKAAGVLLPLSEDPNLSWKYGTRHRAAVGLSEISDSRCIVVSEETGNISLVYNGTIQKMPNTDELKRQLDMAMGLTASTQPGQKRVTPFTELLSTELFQKFFSKASPKSSLKEAHTPSSEERSKLNS